jgi:hypothetical protein
VLLALIFAAAALTAAAPFPQTLPPAARGLHCPSGGRAIGDRVGKSYILQELEIDSREAQPKVLGFVYSGADDTDYVDFSPSKPNEKTRLMQDGDIDRRTMMMRYCFAGPWDGTRTASR